MCTAEPLKDVSNIVNDPCNDSGVVHYVEKY